MVKRPWQHATLMNLERLETYTATMGASACLTGRASRHG